MALNRIQAAKLLTDGEMELFQDSLSDQLPSLTASELRARIRRARTLRDKFQDLSRRQRVESRRRTGSKAGAGGTDNARTARKAQAFSEVLQRLEQRQGRLEAAETRATARQQLAGQLRGALKKKRSARAGSAAKEAGDVSAKAPARRTAAGPGPTSERARSARHASKSREAGVPRVLGYVSSQDRRSQSKRDSRG